VQEYAMSAEPEPKRAKGTGVKLAYETIRDEILSLDLPPGALLDETTLAERFGMSRSPVREALIRLAGDDLVVTLSNRSTVVAPIDMQSFPEIRRGAGHRAADEHPAGGRVAHEADLKTHRPAAEGIRRRGQDRQHLAMSEANKAFHMAIAEAGRNPYLSAFYERLLNQGRRMLHLHFAYLESGHGGYLLTDEHDEMLDAIRDRDVARADALAHAHTRQFRDNFIEFLKHNHLQDAPITAPLDAPA
jgi:DNA-binding GntR family transcriptional regulator